MVGATVDGFVSARYTTSHLRSIVWTTGVVAIDITSAITRTAYTIMGLVYLTTAAAAAGSPHLDKIILGANAQFGVAFNSSGLLVFHYTGTFPAVTVACSTGAWRFFCVRYAGGTVQIDIDKTYGTPTVLTVALPFSSSDCQMGFNTFGTPASAFDIMERMTFQSSISDADRDGYYSYLRARYPSAGLPA